MRAWTNIDSMYMKKSIVLPTNPLITDIIPGNEELTVYWNTKDTEVEIDHFNIYYSTSKPTHLKDMTKIGSADASVTEYTIKGLSNTKYYIAVESVNTEGYENASLLEVKDVIVGDMCFVSVGSTGTAYCIDCENWLEPTQEVTGVDVTYGNNRFVTGSGKDIMYSYDCKNWKTSAINTTSEKYIKRLTYGDGRFYLVLSYSSTISHLYYSLDAITWIYIGTGATAPGYNYDQNMPACYGNGMFIWGYKNYGLTHSYDGNTIKQITRPYGFYPYAVCYSRDKEIFIAIGSCDDGYYGGYYSLNGKDWYAISSLLNKKFMNMKESSLCYGNNMFVFINYNTPYYSLNEEDWIVCESLPVGTSFSITFDNSSKRFVAVATNRASYYSINGKDWIRMNDTPCSMTNVIAKNWY